jgi:hypothetical protein
MAPGFSSPKPSADHERPSASLLLQPSNLSEASPLHIEQRV